MKKKNSLQNKVIYIYSLGVRSKGKNLIINFVLQLYCFFQSDYKKLNWFSFYVVVFVG
jgi:hypothetical protein